MTGRRFQTSIVDDPIDPDLGVRWSKIFGWQREYNRLHEVLESRLGKESNMKKISMFRVYAVYGESPERPLIFRPKDEFAFGADEDEAVLRSGIYIVIAAARKEPTTEPLDPRYVTIVVERVGDIKTP